MPTTISGSTGVSQIQDGTVTDADISALAASKLTGTIADARFPATLPAASGANLTALPAGNLTGTVADARFPATLPAASGVNLTAIPAANLTGTVADARISALTASKLTGALPAISGASLTGLTSAQMPAGSVLQVVTAESQTPATTTANAWAASAITASITPSATSSKVLVLANFYTSTTSTSMSISYTIFQDGSTNLGNGTYGFGSSMGVAAEAQGSINVVSSPSTTSAVAYKVYFNRRDGAGTSTCGQANRKSVITLMEIAG